MSNTHVYNGWEGGKSDQTISAQHTTRGSHNWNAGVCTPWACVPQDGRGGSSVVECQTCNRQISDLSSGRRMFSKINFLSWLSFWQHLFHPCVTAAACKRSWLFCQRCKWQVTAKHTCTIHMWLWIKWHYKLVHSYIMHTECVWDGSSFMWHQSCHN